MNLTRKILLGADVVDAQKKFDPEVRAKYMNASEAMSCIRKQWYAKNRADEGEDQNWGFARRGTHAETYVVDRLIAANVHTMYMGDDQLGLRDDIRGISATPDGYVIDEDAQQITGVEIKSIDPRTNRKNLPKASHIAQLQIAMELTSVSTDHDLPDYPIVEGKLIYINASDFDDILEFDVPRKVTILDDLAPRAKRLLSARTAARLSREGKETGGYECNNMCAFKKICGVDTAPIAGSTQSGRGNKGSIMHASLGTYLSAKADETEAKVRKDKAAEEIKTELKSRKVNEITVDNHSITLAAVAGRKSLDRKAIEKAGIDLTPYETVGAQSERLTIK